jgi:hypothetical protein
VKFNPHLYPANGFFYVGPDGARHEAADAGTLLAKVREYEKRRGIISADLDQRIIDFVCRNNPGFCQQQDEVKIIHPVNQISLAARISSYLAQLFRRTGERRVSYLDPAVVAKRVSSCRGCPAQIDLPGTCPSCVADISTLSAILQKGRRHGQETLKACRVLGIDTRVAVMVDEKPPVSGTLPDGCWVK